MKNTIKSIVLAAATFTSPLYAGESDANLLLPQTEPSYPVSAKVFAASVIQDSDTYAFGGGVSLETALYQDLHGELVGSFFEDEVYHVGGNLLYYVPVSQTFSVYALAGGGYDFKTDQWTVATGGGVSLVLSTRTSVFVDGAYNFNVSDSDADGAVTVRTGVSFKF